MYGIGATELTIIAVIVLLIFGAKNLPEIGKGLGGAIREFKNVKKEISLDDAPDEDQKTTTASLEAKVADKVLEQTPGLKKAVELKKKAEKVKKLID